MVILYIETSTTVCSAAASENGKCLIQKINNEGMNHARLINTFIDEILQFLKAEGKTIDAIALSQGPGSYTGIRIGTATAKGLCYGFDIPLIAVDTLRIIATAAQSTQGSAIENDALLCPMIDARRMEVYDEVYNSSLETIVPIQPHIIDETAFDELLDTHKIYFFGDGASKCRDTITHSNATFVDNIYPEAQYMIALAEEKYQNKQFEDIAYFDPLYLKEFQATTPKKQL